MLEGGSMKHLIAFGCFTVLIGLCQSSLAQVSQKVVDIPTRPGVTQRFVYLAPESPRAAVILLAGGHGGLQISPNGKFKWGEGNFVVRTRQLFEKHGLSAAVVDAPSDRQVQNIAIPVLVVHHEQDGCKDCAYREIPRLMEKLSSAPRKELVTYKGGENRGDPCEPFAYHGFNGLEKDVVARIAEWIIRTK